MGPCLPGEYHVFDSTRTYAFGAILFWCSISTASSDQDACQNIIAWNCGSGASIQTPSRLQDVVAIDAGDIFSVALRRNGQVVVWGNPPNDVVEVSGGPWSQPYLLPRDAQFQATAIAAGQEHGVVLTADGSLIEWHQDYTPAHQTLFGTYSDVVDLAAGGDGPIQDVWNGQPHYPFLLILHAEGSITVRGDNVAGTNGNAEFGIQQLPDFPAAIHAVAAGRNHALALSVEGDVIGWGSNDHGETNIPTDLLDGEVMAIAAGKDHSLAVRENGTVVAWGSNDHGQCDVPRNLRNVVAVAGGQSHSLAVLANGDVVAWGSNEFGQCEPPPTLTDVRAIACGRWHSLALSGDGTITAWGDDRYDQSSVNPEVNEAFDDLRDLAVGSEHRLAVNIKGEVIAWGDNQHGQIDVPSSLDAVIAVAAGHDHSLALESTGTVVAWGANDLGQCDVPSGLQNVHAVCAGARHTLALLSDGSVVAWGDNDAGQCDVPENLANVIALAAGDDHSLALRYDGSIEAWGSDQYGQCLVPKGLQNIRAIGAGGRHSLAVRNDGVVFAWGMNAFKEIDVPDDLPPVVSVQGGNHYSMAIGRDGRLFAWGDCGERRPGPPIFQRRYAASCPTTANHLLLAAGPDDVMAIEDTCPPCSPADFNRDNVVNAVDMLFFFDVLGEVCVGDGGDACAADLNHDGAVGLDDLSVLFHHWGPCGIFRITVPGLEAGNRG